MYRPRTDVFNEARKASRDTERIERTRLERRLEKLINLHFPPESQKLREKPEQHPPPRPNKRLSSIFEMDFSELRGKSASDLWRDVVQSQGTPGGKNDIRGTWALPLTYRDGSLMDVYSCGTDYYTMGG